MGKNKTLRTREAGALVEQVCYRRAERNDDSRARAVKKKRTTEVMQKYNHTTSVRKFELMIAANFAPGAVVGTVTYDDRHLPTDRKSAERRFRYFRQKLAKHYKARGVELVALWSTEHKHGDGRWHHHFILPSTGGDYDAIRAAWIYGTLAAYYAKEARDKLGLRAWSYTRNAAKPREDVERVEDDYQLQAPKGVQVLERTSIETPYGSFQYLKYLRPEDFKPRPRARQRKRKR